MLVYIILQILVFIFYVIQSMIKPRKFPPGPRWYPLFGSSCYVKSLTKKHGSRFKALLELSKEHSSDVIGLNLDGEIVVIFFGESNIKATLIAEEFEGRPDNFFTKTRSFGKRAGISFVDGSLWKIHRRFTSTHLQKSGFGKSTMEKDIQNTLFDLVHWLKQNKEVWPNDFMPLLVINVLWKCTAGTKISPEKWSSIQRLQQTRGGIMDITGGILNRAPWIRFLLPEYTGYNTMLKTNEMVCEIIKESILKHKNEDVEKPDFMNYFLNEMVNKRDTFTEEQLLVICSDLMLGSTTTANAIEFAILHVLRDQNMQKKIQEEIDQVLGDDIPSWSDRSRLIYTSAFTQELLRYYTIIPSAGPRRALKETYIKGYYVPKDATVLMSLGDIHKDHNLWEDPHKFKPERFIDEYGRIKRLDHYYPFGLGRRRCPGDVMARMLLFILFTGLMQKFTVTSTDPHLPSNEPDIGMVVASAKRFKAVFQPRMRNLYK